MSYPKRPCWNWRYHEPVQFNVYPVYSDTILKLQSSLADKFGSQGICWDLTAVKRRPFRHSRNRYQGSYYYQRISVHFKRSEDLVMYKLTYKFNSVNGDIDV